MTEIETKYYPPIDDRDGILPPHGCLEAWLAWPDSRQVFLIAKPGETRASLEQRAKELLSGA